MLVCIDNRSGEQLPEEELEELALFVLQDQDAPENLELSLSFVTADEIRQLNFDFRGKDAATDVLSFECDDLADAELNVLKPEVFLLGDIVIAPSIARQHALDFGSTLKQELFLIETHGILHLLGYDHLVDADAEAMEAQEDRLLAAWAQYLNKKADG
ncbi:MAG: rRNA maturation RNase YbeY [Coriobacteriaceae bacterium]|nr:rRNA maturation RNase YbeY [Coriobacteriaceae bacterium]